MKLIYIFLISIVQVQVSAQIFQKEFELGALNEHLNEPSIALNNQHPQREIIACNINHIFYRNKKKASFKKQILHDKLGVAGDPVLMFGNNQICYLSHLAKGEHKERPESFDQIVVHTSTNNGKTWSIGVGTGVNGKMHDKPWMSINHNKSTANYGNVYLTWTEFDAYESTDKSDSSRILFSKSVDFGKSFSKPITINDESGDCLDDDSTLEGVTTCVGRNDVLFACWAGKEQIYLDKSVDDGRTWGKDQVLFSTPKGWNLKMPNIFRANGMPFLNSTSEGKLMICTAYEVNGYNQVLISSSENNGENWSLPMALQTESESHYFMPHAFVDNSNYDYYVIYYRLKNNQIDVLLSFLKNGNDKFETIKVNDNSFMVSEKNIFMGDYIGVCAVKGYVATVWTEIKENSTVLKTRRIKM